MPEGDRQRRRTTRAVIAAAVAGDEFHAPVGASIDAELLRDLIDGVHGTVDRRGIRLRDLKIVGDVDLTYAKWSGVLELVHCVIEGDVLLTHADLRGHIELRGTTLRTLDIRYVNLQGRLTGAGLAALRGVRGLGANITGALALQDAVLTAPPEAVNKNLAALDIYRASIGDLFLSRSTLNGGLYAIGASVVRNVRLQQAKVWSREELGLPAAGDAGGGVDLAGVHVGGSIYLCSPSGSGELEMHGSVSLSGADSRNFWVSSGQLRTMHFNLNGFAYRRLSPATGYDVLSTLSLAEPFPDQGYTQLADFAAQTGATHLRRRALIAQQRRIARSYPASSLEGMRRRAFGIFVGYGYAPWRALLWLFAVLTAAVLALHAGGFTHGLEIAGATPSWPEAVILALDHMLPFAGLDAKSHWVLMPHGAWAWVWFGTFLLLKLTAWLLAALALASAAGLIRRT